MTVLELTKLYEVMRYSVSPLEESSIVDNLKYIDTIKKICESYVKNNTIKWSFINSPYFTDVEYNDLMNEHMAVHHQLDQIKDINLMNYDNRINRIQNSIKNTADNEEKDKLKNDLLFLGWNPNVEHTPKNQTMAMERIESEYNKELSEAIIIDCSSDIINSHNEHFSRVPFRDVCPYYIFVHESGKFAMVNHYIKTPPRLPSQGKCEVYTFFGDSILEEEFVNEVFEYKPIAGIFPIPMKVIAVREMRTLYEDIDKDLNGKKPILKKAYEGPINETPVKKINEWAIMTYLNPHRSAPFNLDNMIVPSEKYTNVNLLSDQY